MEALRGRKYQLIAVAAHALDHLADVGKLLLVRKLPVEFLRLSHGRKIVPIQFFLQKLFRRAVAVTHLIGKVDGDLTGSCSGHIVLPHFGYIQCISIKKQSLIQCYYTRFPHERKDFSRKEIAGRR